MLKKCSKCSRELDFSSFSCTKRNPDGSCKYFASWCNGCRTEYNRKGNPARKKPEITSDGKECLSCNKFLSFDNFSPSTRGKAGFQTYCKNCHSVKYKVSKEDARVATQKYRDNNREVWREKHRINMFKRRKGIDAASDGTVTKDFVIYIYSLDTCYWCKNKVEVRDRTLEHIKELNNGGLHSVDNITMACKSCNSARRNKDDKHNRDDCS